MDVRAEPHLLNRFSPLFTRHARLESSLPNIIPSLLFRLPTTLLIATLGFFAVQLGTTHASAQGSKADKVMASNDGNGDGRLDLDEWPKSKQGFKKMDVDGDGFLTPAELNAYFNGGKAKQKTKPPAPKPIKTAAPSPRTWPDLYFIDAHSQVPKGLNMQDIIPLMDQAGVRRVILSARNDRPPQDVADFAKAHPDRITAAIRSKGKTYNEGQPGLEGFINNQLNQPVFQALAEALLFHAKKGNKAPEINVSINDPQATLLLNIAREKNWPFISHYEFRATKGRKDAFMKEFEDKLKANRNVAFPLIHMGQLEHDEARRLIESHDNVYFMTSHSNPVTKAKSKSQPWSNLFDGSKLSAKWKELMIAHPDRFILTFDNVWPEHWGDYYLRQAELWRNALGDLPPDVAQAIAHGNAERLWRLAP